MNVLLVTSPHLDHTAYHRVKGLPQAGASHLLAQRFVPMGLLSLAGAVDPEANVVVADLNKAINSGEVPVSDGFYAAMARWLLRHDPDLIGFMTEADSYHHLLRISAAIKAERKRTFTLLGGPHASAVHTDTLEHFADVDFVIRGEGEHALRDLVRALTVQGDLSDVGNLTYRRDGMVTVNAELPLIDNLDSLPFPDLGRVAYAPGDQLFVEVGRGCPFRCNFCFTAPYWKRRHRIKSAARIIEELTYFRDRYSIRDVNFTHDLFTTDRRWVIDFCRQLTSRDLGITWTCSSRTDTLDEEQIDWMRRSGCRNIYFGIESGTDEMQARIRKDLDLGQARRIVAATVAAGMGVTVGFIAGLPGESARTLRGTLKEALHYLRLNGSIVHLFGFNPYRGSAHFEEILPHLIPDPHFVDFPLPESVLEENGQMIRQSPGIFSRYWWMGAYDGLDTSVLSACEEYFPMVNALRDFMLCLDNRGIDPLIMVQDWATWVGEDNRSLGSGPRGLFQGSISRFLVFLKQYLARTIPDDRQLFELLRWEMHKNALRTLAPESPIPALFRGTIPTGPPGRIDTREYPVDLPDAVVKRNPTLIVDRFEFLEPSYALGQTLSGIVAFYLRSGSPVIVRLPPFSVLAINLAGDGAAVADLIDALCLGAAAGERGPVTKGVEELLRQELLVAPAPGGRSQHSESSRGAVEPSAISDDGAGQFELKFPPAVQSVADHPPTLVVVRHSRTPIEPKLTVSHSQRRPLPVLTVDSRALPLGIGQAASEVPEVIVPVFRNRSAGTFEPPVLGTEAEWAAKDQGAMEAGARVGGGSDATGRSGGEPDRSCTSASPPPLRPHE